MEPPHMKDKYQIEGGPIEEFWLDLNHLAMFNTCLDRIGLNWIGSELKVLPW